VAVLIVLLFLTAPLAWIPNAALGVILIASSFGLLDFKGMWRLRHLNHQEFWICVATLLGVLIIGVMPGIILAVALSIIRFLTQVARPVDQQLGCIEGRDGFYELSDYPDAKPMPGLLLYRFESPLTFFNADYFRQRVKTLIDNAKNPVHWVVIDTISMGDIDVTGIFTLIELGKTLDKQNMKLVLTGRTRRIIKLLDGWTAREDIQLRFFPTRRGALAAFYEDEAQRAQQEQEASDQSKPPYSAVQGNLQSISNILPNKALNDDPAKTP
jgi:MFS superfamily sulfate permease-like transporter